MGIGTLAGGIASGLKTGIDIEQKRQNMAAQAELAAQNKAMNAEMASLVGGQEQPQTQQPQEQTLSQAQPPGAPVAQKQRRMLTPEEAGQFAMDMAMVQAKFGKLSPDQLLNLHQSVKKIHDEGIAEAISAAAMGDKTGAMKYLNSKPGAKIASEDDIEIIDKPLNVGGLVVPNKLVKAKTADGKLFEINTWDFQARKLGAETILKLQMEELKEKNKDARQEARETAKDEREEARETARDARLNKTLASQEKIANARMATTLAAIERRAAKSGSSEGPAVIQIANHLVKIGVAKDDKDAWRMAKTLNNKSEESAILSLTSSLLRDGRYKNKNDAVAEARAIYKAATSDEESPPPTLASAPPKSTKANAAPAPPQEVMAKLKPGVKITTSTGEVWALRNGKPVNVAGQK